MSDEKYEGLGIQEYDLREQRETHRHAQAQDALELKRQSEQASVRRERWEAIGTVGVALAVAIAFVGGLYVLWLSMRGPSVDDQQHQEARLACIDKGGVWIDGADTDSRGNGGTFGTCAFGLQ